MAISGTTRTWILLVVAIILLRGAGFMARLWKKERNNVDPYWRSRFGMIVVCTYRIMSRLTYLIAICLTTVTMLTQSSFGQGYSDLKVDLATNGPSSCDKKAIQQAKEDFDKAMKLFAKAIAERDRIDGEMEAAYKEGEAAFDEAIGELPGMGFTELTMHTAATLGSEAAERLAPAVTVFELSNFLVSMGKSIVKDAEIWGKAAGHASEAAKIDSGADAELAAALEAKSRRERLEAGCKEKAARNHHASNALRTVWKPFSSAIWEVQLPQGLPGDAESSGAFLARTKNLLVIGGASSQNLEGADLRNMIERNRAVYIQHEHISSLCFIAYSTFVDASAFVQAATMVLPSPIEKTAKLSGADLAKFKKPLTTLFQKIAKGVQSSDQVGAELTKLGRLKGKRQEI